MDFIHIWPGMVDANRTWLFLSSVCVFHPVDISEIQQITQCVNFMSHRWLLANKDWLMYFTLLQILNLYSVVMMDEFTMTFDLIKLAIILMTAVPGCSKIRAAA